MSYNYKSFDNEIPAENLTQKDIMQFLLHSTQHVATREELQDVKKELKNDINKLDKKIKNFRKLFPEYSHLKLYAGIASFHIYEDAKELAKQKGYFVLQRNGNIIEEYVADELKVA